MLDELEWPSLEARRDRSSLLLFHRIHSGAVSIEKDKYLTPARSLKSTRSSHSAQYCRYQTYSDALKNSFPPPRTIPQWNSLSLSVVNSQTTEEFSTAALRGHVKKKYLSRSHDIRSRSHNIIISFPRFKISFPRYDYLVPTT